MSIIVIVGGGAGGGFATRRPHPGAAAKAPVRPGRQASPIDTLPRNRRRLAQLLKDRLNYQAGWNHFNSARPHAMDPPANRGPPGHGREWR